MTADILDFASATGGDVATGLTFTSATFVRKVIDGRLEYSEIKFATADSLAGVLPGHKLTVSDFVNANNNGVNMHILDVLPDGVIVQMVERSSALEDETGVTVSGDITTDGAALKPLSIAHNALGMTIKEKLSAAHFNWILFGLVRLVQNAVGVFSSLSTWASETRIASKAELVRGLGWLFYDYGNDEMAGEGVYPDDNDDGRGFIESTHPDAVMSMLAAFQAEVLPAVTASLNFGSTAQHVVNTLTVTVPGALPGDGVTLGPPSTIEAGFLWSGYVSAANTVTIRLAKIASGTLDPAEATWSVRVTRPNSMPVITVRGLKIFVNLIGEVYDSTSLEADLSIPENEAAFNLLVNSRQHRAAILDGGTIESIVSSSATADAIITASGGY